MWCASNQKGECMKDYTVKTVELVVITTKTPIYDENKFKETVQMHFNGKFLLRSSLGEKKVPKHNKFQDSELEKAKGKVPRKMIIVTYQARIVEIREDQLPKFTAILDTLSI